MKAKVAFTVDQDVLREIDRLRGIAGRSAFINHILKIGLRAYITIEKQAKRRENTCPPQIGNNEE